MKKVLFIIGCLLFLGWNVTRFYMSEVQFEQNCGGHLKRAADANNVTLAKEELRAALDYIEKEDLTEGYTSIFYRTPDEDLSFWYRNVKSAYENVARIDQDSIGDLEESNLLIKLRETLVDKGQSTTVTVPSGISVYPSNKLFAFWVSLSSLLMTVFGIWWFIDFTKNH